MAFRGAVTVAPRLTSFYPQFGLSRICCEISEAFFVRLYHSGDIDSAASQAVLKAAWKL